MYYWITRKEGRKTKFYILSILFFFASLHASAQQPSIIVFYSSDKSQVKNAPKHALIYDVTQTAKLERKMQSLLPNSKGLKNTRLIFQKKLKSNPQMKKIVKDIANSYEWLSVASSLGVAKIPAVIIDSQYVVYGEHNVKKAIALVDRYKRNQ